MRTLVGMVCASARITREHQHFDDIYALSLSYLTGGITAFQFQKEARPLFAELPINARDFRMSLHKQRYPFDLKCWIFHVCSKWTGDRVEARALAKIWRIDLTEDFPCVWRLLRTQGAWRARVRRIARAASRVHEFSPAYVERLFNEVLPDVDKYSRVMANRKLRFVCRSQNLDMADMLADLKVKVVDAYYKVFPCDMSADHIGNYLRRTVHNTTMNIIETYTSQKAGRLVSTDAAHSNHTLLVVSENQLNRNSTENEISYDELGGSVDMSSFESEFSLNQLLQQYAHKRKHFMFLLLLMGQTDECFTAWLKRKGYALQGEDNADVQDRVAPREYTALAATYLRFPEERVSRFLRRIQKELGNDKLAA